MRLNIEKLQVGGIFKPQVDTTGFYNRAVQLNDKNKNLNWISRQNNNTGNELKYKFKPEDNQEGVYGTMLTSYTDDKQGNQLAFPQIQQLPGQNKLTYFSNWKDALNSAIKNKEVINMGKDANFADYYTTVGDKLNQRPEVLQEAKQDYKKNTNIKLVNIIPSTKNNFKMFLKGGIIKGQSGINLQNNTVKPLTDDGMTNFSFTDLNTPRPNLINPVLPKPTFNNMGIINNPNTSKVVDENTFLNYWANQENSIKKGWDPNKKVWHPYPSIEKGADTVAYGLKLGINPEFDKRAKLGVTDQEAAAELKNRMAAGQLQIKSYLNKNYGTGSYDKLPDSTKYAMLDLHLNTKKGIAGFPAFIKDAIANNKQGMLKESVRPQLPTRTAAFQKTFF